MIEDWALLKDSSNIMTVSFQRSAVRCLLQTGHVDRCIFLHEWRTQLAQNSFCVLTTFTIYRIEVLTMMLLLCSFWNENYLMYILTAWWLKASVSVIVICPTPVTQCLLLICWTDFTLFSGQNTKESFVGWSRSRPQAFYCWCSISKPAGLMVSSCQASFFLFLLWHYWSGVRG